jgi:trehalose/maltose hydrolase-like predicted phosphorylase
MKNNIVNNPWSIIEKTFTIENNYVNETLFSTGNGCIGMRGNFEEGYSGPKGTGLEGIYINGFYESEVIKYGEVAYGYAEKSQSMLNVTNSKIIKLYINDEEFDMLKGEVLDYERRLDFKEGILKRNLIWKSPSGKEVKIYIERLVSLKHKHLAAIHYEVTPLNFNGKLKLISSLDGNVTNLTTENDPRVGSGFQGRVLSIEEKRLDDTFGAIVQKTENTRFAVACAADHALEVPQGYSIENLEEELKISSVFFINAELNNTIKLDKYIAYTTSRDYEEEEILINAYKEVKAAKKAGFEFLKKEQIDFLNDFWYRTDIEIKGDDLLQQGIRFNMFHLLQSVGRDGKTNIAAKGLTGEGYEGHYFWDTEIFMLPFFLYNNPEISRKLLEYRYSTLPKARERARIMSHKRGALYPWRTIDGEECSAYFPAGTAQYHIDADIAFAIKRYMEATEDKEFLIKYGAEVLFETARLWADLGEFIQSKGNKFCINEVTGPDEYTALVNNNCYTNLMARENLEYAHRTALWMKKNAEEDYKTLIDKIELEETELAVWKKAADNMYIPYNEELKIYPQDDSFLDRTPWDFENTPKESHPLLIHYHPLVIYRHQVCKQADLVLAQFLLSNKFDKEQKRRDYDFYEKVTTHDSSLSTCIFSIVASEVGYYDKAYEYFIDTAAMDLTNSHGNTKDGIHAANMAGAWMCLVNGFAGMRAFEDTLSFNPYLPEHWEEYSFKVTYRGRLIEVRVSKEGTIYRLLEGEELVIVQEGIEKLIIKNGEN